MLYAVSRLACIRIVHNASPGCLRVCGQLFNIYYTSVGRKSWYKRVEDVYNFVSSFFFLLFFDCWLLLHVFFPVCRHHSVRHLCSLFSVKTHINLYIFHLFYFRMKESGLDGTKLSKSYQKYFAFVQPFSSSPIFVVSQCNTQLVVVQVLIHSN